MFSSARSISLVVCLALVAVLGAACSGDKTGDKAQPPSAEPPSAGEPATSAEPAPPAEPTAAGPSEQAPVAADSGAGTVEPPVREEPATPAVEANADQKGEAEAEAKRKAEAKARRAAEAESKAEAARQAEAEAKERAAVEEAEAKRKTEAEAPGSIRGKVLAKKKKYRKNAVVYLDRVGGKHKRRRATVNQRKQKFVPFVRPIVRGATVSFLNSDNTGHNVFSPDGEKFDLGTWAKGEKRSYKFDKLGTYTLLCKMHPSMIGYVVVLQNPYFAVTDSAGSFEIKRVPPGTYKLKVWHERKKASPISVRVEAGKTVDAELALK